MEVISHSGGVGRGIGGALKELTNWDSGKGIWALLPETVKRPAERKPINCLSEFASSERPEREIAYCGRRVRNLPNQQFNAGANLVFVSASANELAKCRSCIRRNLSSAGWSRQSWATRKAEIRLSRR
jgi:hypothetical protein